MVNQTLHLRGKRVLFADNEADLRRVVTTPLEAVGLEVMGCASGIELQRVLANASATFHVVVVDLWDMGTHTTRFIPERDIPALIQMYPQIPFIVYSSEAYQVQQYEDAGARGYVLKADGVRGLLRALEAVLVQQREMHYSPSIECTYRLSRQDRQILKLAAQGHTSRQIGERLNYTLATIETYLGRIRDKLDANNTVEAVAIAMREGLIR